MLGYHAAFCLDVCAICLKNCAPWVPEVDGQMVRTTLTLAHKMWSFTYGSSEASAFLGEYKLLWIIGCLDCIFFFWILTFNFGFMILLEDCAFSLGFCFLWGGKRSPQKSNSARRCLIYILADATIWSRELLWSIVQDG